MAQISKSAVWILLGVLVVMAIASEAGDTKICNIVPSRLSLCRPAVSGKSPQPPTRRCCRLLRAADLKCLCDYKEMLPAVGINPELAMALPEKCGLTLPVGCNP
uniref:Bifunctional inhibitor/plant lipid transfer protein/seed storage helical domain-containing protein n=1 Tax=Kalanchoe fedtschenkoi TaxID=63787 RepID=A0A7N0VMU7_KALFE